MKDAYHPKAFTVEQKITATWYGEDRNLKEFMANKNGKDFSAKVNVPDPHDRLSITRMRKEKCAAHSIPHKVTSKTKYGSYPDFKVSTDTVHLRRNGPDERFDRIAQHPSHTKIMGTAAPSPTTPRTPRKERGRHLLVDNT